MPYWKRMSSGRYIDLGNFTVDDVHIEDIEPSLNFIYRFTGHHKDIPPLTVAQHSLLCMRLAAISNESPLIQRACLVHDFAEAYIGDVATPVKKAMGKGWRDFAGPIEYCVNEKFCPEANLPEVHEVVKFYDSMCLDIERRTMWNSQVGKDKWPDYPEGLSLKEKRKLFFDVAFHDATRNGGVQLSKYLEDLNDKA